jgi:hypothetical protein
MGVGEVIVGIGLLLWVVLAFAGAVHRGWPPSW